MTGEGFAYFRWHFLRWGMFDMVRPASKCPGCYRWWNQMQRNHRG